MLAWDWQDLEQIGKNNMLVYLCGPITFGRNFKFINK